MSEEKRMLGNYEVVNSIYIGDKEVVFGVDKSDKYPFLVSYCDYHNPFGVPWATESVGCDDYLEAMGIFIQRVQSQIEQTKSELSKFAFDNTVFTKDHCIPDKRSSSIVGKVVVINAEPKRYEYQHEKSSAFVISQEDIDSVLLSGSGFQNGKYRIYRQFQKNEDSKGNIDFLKKEYGTGGGTHYFPDGTQGHTWHDGKGIAIEKYGSSATPDLVLSWAKVEKRLRELIKNDRYLNEKEKDHYADYLESEEAPQYEIDTQRKMARQRFIDANRDLPPADKRDTLALRLSDFIRDLDGYEKDLLENVERTDIADVTAEQMEQHLGDPSRLQCV